jgi:hypothetical protein
LVVEESLPVEFGVYGRSVVHPAAESITRIG